MIKKNITYFEYQIFKAIYTNINSLRSFLYNTNIGDSKKEGD